MFFRFKPIILATFLTIPVVAGSQNKPALDTVVATVNTSQITLAHVLTTYRELPDEYRKLPSDALFKGIVDQLVQQEILSQAAGDPPIWASAALENATRQLRAGLTIQDTLRSAVDEKNIKDAYDAQFSDFQPQTEYKASHILVESEKKALDVVKQLNDGADFAAIARDYSTGPSGPSGGDLGWFTKGQMVAAFEDAVAQMQVDEISNPVQTQFGWHVIKLDDKRIQNRPNLEDVRAQLIQILEQTAVENRINSLKDSANVIINTQEIDPSVLTLPISELGQ